MRAWKKEIKRKIEALAPLPQPEKKTPKIWQNLARVRPFFPQNYRSYLNPVSGNSQFDTLL